MAKANHKVSASFAIVLLIVSFILPIPSMASAWTTGEKTIMFIRVDFSDLPGDPVSESLVEEEMRKTAEFFREASYGRFKLSRWVITKTVRMPSTYSEYENMHVTVQSISKDARTAAELAGYKPNDFNLDIVCFQKPKRPKNPEAEINKIHAVALHNRRGLLVRPKATDGRTFVHELGHNLGLTHEHAASWQTKDGSIIGAGERKSRGNFFDRMGGTYFWEQHFNSRSKYQLGWIDDKNIARVRQSGIYTLEAHDSAAASGLLALEVIDSSNVDRKYWVEYRQKFVNNERTSYGVLIHWSYSNGKTDLLNMNPASRKGIRDGALSIGRTFSDSQANIHITPLLRHDRDPAKIDVRVEINPINNRPPQLELQSPRKTFSIKEPITVEAVCNDPDNDQLAYYWEFSDGVFSMQNVSKLGNGSPLTRHFDEAGNFFVRCTVSDMKGGVTEKQFDFNVKR